MKEALDVLALRPGATPTEIKEAYRDLVKVWHPDRFGSDPRLRQKAEEKLRQINDAYRVVQSRPAMDDRYASETDTAVGSHRDDASSMKSSSSEPVSRRSRKAAGVGWIYGGLGIALGCLAGYLVLQHGTLRGAMQTAGATPAPLPQAADANHQAVPASSVAQTPGEGVGSNVHAAERLGGSAEAGGHLNHAGSAPYRVYSLSEAQTSQLESACSSQRELHGEAAYNACVKAQLDLMINASSAPDLSALSGAEGESIESVCSEVKRHRGADAYNPCLNSQMAELAAEPSRPDLSVLSEADRSSIESACRSAKYREGPAAYDRCLVRFTKLLAETK
jgi:hypothetical protein